MPTPSLARARGTTSTLLLCRGFEEGLRKLEVGRPRVVLEGVPDDLVEHQRAAAGPCLLERVVAEMSPERRDVELGSAELVHREDSDLVAEHLGGREKSRRTLCPPVGFGDLGQKGQAGGDALTIVRLDLQ